MTSQPQDSPPFDDVIEPPDTGLPNRDRSQHGGMPLHPDDDGLAGVAAEERVAAGLADYAPDAVPPATDPLPEGSSEAADLAQRGLDGTESP
jgi:hypothetical protein